MADLEKSGGKYGYYLLSECDSAISVTARANEVPVPDDTAICLGRVTTEQTGHIEADMILHPPGETRVVTGCVSYPHPAGVEKLIFMSVLIGLQNEYRLKKVDDYTSIISPDRSIDDISFIQLESNTAPASQSHAIFNTASRISVFSNRTDDEYALLPYGVRNVDAVILKVGRIFARVANSINEFYGDERSANLNIGLPGLAIGRKVE